jgi:hypothetical protein
MGLNLAWDTDKYKSLVNRNCLQLSMDISAIASCFSRVRNLRTKRCERALCLGNVTLN